MNLWVQTVDSHTWGWFEWQRCYLGSMNHWWQWHQRRRWRLEVPPIETTQVRVSFFVALCCLSTCWIIHKEAMGEAKVDFWLTGRPMQWKLHNSKTCVKVEVKRRTQLNELEEYLWIPLVRLSLFNRCLQACRRYIQLRGWTKPNKNRWSKDCKGKDVL